MASTTGERAEDCGEESSLLGALARAEAGLTAAETSYWRVLAVLERSVGSGHPEVATVHRRIADVHHGRGRASDAEAHARTALAVRTAALGRRHPDAASDEAALGLLLVAQGRHDEAEPLLRGAFKTLRTVLGPQSPEASLVARELAAMVTARAGVGVRRACQ